MNTFLAKKYNTVRGTVPFQEIKFEDYEPAIMEGIRQEEDAIQAIINNPEEPTFENTILPRTDELLNNATTVFFNLLSANTSDEMDALAQKLSPILTEHSNKILHNKKLFDRIRHVKEHHRPLTEEEKMLLDKVFEGFERSGACLSDEAKSKLMQKEMELSQLTLQFSQNNLKETNAFQLHITQEEDTEGLPETALDAARFAAQEKELEGWLFTLHAPSYNPFMTYAKNRELRRQMYMAKNTLCAKGGERDNKDIVSRIVNLRREIAQILGYPTFADFVLKRRMAENTQNVYKLLHQLLEAYKPQAEKEVAEVIQIAKEEEGAEFDLMPWDFAYYSHKLKLSKYNLDAEMLRPYFQLEKVKEGVFGLATKLYGITFHRNADIQVYHPDVEAYEVMDCDGTYLGVLYTDFFPRESKQSGAWMTSYQEQYIDEAGTDIRPHVSITTNFTKPTPEKPSLLTLGEVETFLHEFGHALHGLFSKVRFQPLSGTNVYWDFVELPSQFMENYVTQPDFLHTFAFHYQTGEPIPEELIERILLSRNFQCGYACVRQVSFGLLDMAYYTLAEPFAEDVLCFEKKAWEETQLLPALPETNMSVQFGHIMSGGYAAGYYSYKWAEVLDADAFGLFQENGIFDKQTASRFRNELLSKGGIKHPLDLYVAFRGQRPTINALLKRNGIDNG